MPCRPALSFVLPFAIACTGHTTGEKEEPARVAVAAPDAGVAAPVPAPTATDDANTEADDPDDVEPAPVQTEPTPEPVPAPRVHARDRFPRNLHIAFPERETGWVVDIIDLYGRNGERVIAALELSDEMSLDDVTLVPGGPGLPRGWKVGDTWTLVTAEGVVRREVARYGLEQGASEIHVRVELARARTRARKPVLAVRGSAVPDDLVFDVPTPRDGMALGEGGIERMRAAIVSATRDRETRKLFARARIAAQHVEIYDAQLPEPWTAVAFLDAPSRGWGEPARASALLLLAADGTLRHVGNPGVEGGTLRARAILDVDGNGVDEVFYEDGYSEGSYEKVVWFDGDRPKQRTLAGDGA